MKTLKELEEKHAEEMAKLKIKLAITEEIKSLPAFDELDSSICIHSLNKKPHVSVRLWKDYHTDRKIADALAVVLLCRDRIIDGEHWKSGCVSTWPAEINSCIADEKATMVGSHAIEISVNGGRGYGPSTSVKFWTKLAGMLCEVSLPVCDLWKLCPRVNGSYTSHGEFVGKVEWPVESRCSDEFRKFWSEAPSYNGSYYWADVPNFESFCSTIKPV